MLDDCPVKVNSLKKGFSSRFRIPKEDMLTPSANFMINKYGFSQYLGVLLTNSFYPMHGNADKIHNAIAGIFLSN